MSEDTVERDVCGSPIIDGAVVWHAATGSYHAVVERNHVRYLGSTDTPLSAVADECLVWHGDVEEIAGILRPLHNSEGELIHETEAGRAAFWRWFGNSRVTDRFGRPLVVLHGGVDAEDIDEFDPRQGGSNTGGNEHGAFFFSASESVARGYSRQAFIRKYENYPQGLVDDKLVPADSRPESLSAEELSELLDLLAEERISILRVYLRLENPVENQCNGDMVDTPENERLIDYIKNGTDDGSLTERFMDQIMRPYPEPLTSSYHEEIQEALKNEFRLDGLPPEDWQIAEATRCVLTDFGFEQPCAPLDGIINRDTIDNIDDESCVVTDVFIVIDPCAIKSTKNNWLFDPDNPRIRDDSAPRRRFRP